MMLASPFSVISTERFACMRFICSVLIMQYIKAGRAAATRVHKNLEIWWVLFSLLPLSMSTTFCE